MSGRAATGVAAGAVAIGLMTAGALAQVEQPATAAPEGPAPATTRAAPANRSDRPRGAVERRIALAAAKSQPSVARGPIEPTWDSVNAHYKDPDWFRDAKFGIMMHWGLYSVPAHGSEWYVRYMYGGNRGIVRWHTEKFGPPDRFGYKDFIPLFTVEKYDPDAWATLFKRSGARYVIPTAEHHDGFALWDSDVTRWDANDMGPKRDLIGEMAVAVRKQGLKFGVSNHRLNHYDFIQRPPADLKTDLYDPANDDFYWVANHSDARYEQFLVDWVARSFEQIDKYQIDMLWYDISDASRNLDPVFLKVTQHYLNRAAGWGKQVAISSKGAAWLGGSIIDYERQGRAPMELTDWTWQADDPIGHNFGYVEGLQLTTADSIVTRLIENTSKNGNLLLNLSPKADGTIPQDQQDLLLAVGRWLEVNGDAIYGTRPWTIYGEGPAADAAAAAMVKIRAAGFAGRINEKNQGDENVAGGGIPRKGYVPQDVRYTTKGGDVYAILMAWPDGGRATVRSLGSAAGKVAGVELLGHGPVAFEQGEQGLIVTLPAEKPCETAFALRVRGADLKPSR